MQQQQQQQQSDPDLLRRLLRNLRARAAQVGAALPPGQEQQQQQHTVVLFYRYVAVSDPERLADEQRQLCMQHQLRGRLLIAEEGVNGTLSGRDQSVRRYIDTVGSAHPDIFGNTDWKLSVGDREPFPDLSVRTVKEVVNTGGLEVDIGSGGSHLSPREFHEELLRGTPENMVLLDVRNTFETEIGHFEGQAVHHCSPGMKSFSQFGAYARNHATEWQGKKLLMYCTGGIRCEKASAFVKALGVRDVGQLSGGIHRYLEEYTDGGLFKGKLGRPLSPTLADHCNCCQAKTLSSTSA